MIDDTQGKAPMHIAHKPHQLQSAAVSRSSLVVLTPESVSGTTTISTNYFTTEFTFHTTDDDQSTKLENIQWGK